MYVSTVHFRTLGHTIRGVAENFSAPFCNLLIKKVLTMHLIQGENPVDRTVYTLKISDENDDCLAVI